jgi:hypothetical protein
VAGEDAALPVGWSAFPAIARHGSDRGAALAERGMDTKQKLIDWLAENARLPALEYWDDQWVQTLLRPLAVAGVEPYASRLKAAPDEIVQMFEPQEINIAVTGGEAQGAWKMFGTRSERTVSIDA